MFAVMEALNHDQAFQSTPSFCFYCCCRNCPRPQQPANQSGPVNEKELKLQRQRLQAISMIKQSAGEAPLWDNKKAAVRALADAADLLWDENPGQGAKWLNKAWDLIEQVSDAPMDEKMKEYSSHSARSDLRAVVLRVARKHDPKLADKFLKQLSQKQWDEKKEHGAFDARTARSEQLLVLALQAVDTEPGLAFSLAEASLADGISHGLQNVLTGLRKKNIPLSNQLFDLALARFSSSQPDPSEAEVLAGYLFYPGTSFSSNSAGQTIFMTNAIDADSDHRRSERAATNPGLSDCALSESSGSPDFDRNSRGQTASAENSGCGELGQSTIQHLRA